MSLSNELLAQTQESLSGAVPRSRHSFYSYQLPESGSLDPTLLATITVEFPPPANVNSPGYDRGYSAKAINGNGDVVGTYQKFERWGPDSFGGLYEVVSPQIWWIPKQGVLTKVNLSAAIFDKIVSTYPGPDFQRGQGPAGLRILDMNLYCEVLVAYSISVYNGTTFGNEVVTASCNLRNGRVILLSRSVTIPEDYDQNVAQILAGKINDSGQVAITRRQSGGGYYATFFNGIAPAGEPIPTEVGFKDLFLVNDLAANGDVGGFQLVGNVSKASIWRAGTVLQEVIDVHAQLPLLDASIQAPYSSAVSRLGVDGTIVGRVITKRPDDPSVDLVRDFVIPGTPS